MVDGSTTRSRSVASGAQAHASSWWSSSRWLIWWPMSISRFQFSSVRSRPTPKSRVSLIGRLGPQRAALFEVLLDLRGAVVDLDRRLDTAVEDLGVEPARGLAVHAPAEDDRGLVGPSERELVGDRRLKPGAPGGRPIEHAGVGDLQLPERERVPVPTMAILRRER